MRKSIIFTSRRSIMIFFSIIPAKKVRRFHKKTTSPIAMKFVCIFISIILFFLIEIILTLTNDLDIKQTILPFRPNGLSINRPLRLYMYNIKCLCLICSWTILILVVLLCSSSLGLKYEYKMYQCF